MSEWLMSLVGVVCLGVLVDVLTPEGKTSKYVKGVIALVVIIVVVSPLPKLASGEIKFDLFKTSYEADGAYLEEVERLRLKQNISSIVSACEAQGFEARLSLCVGEASVSAVGDDGDAEKLEGYFVKNFDCIKIVLSGGVLSENETNIFISGLRSYAAKLLSLNESAVQITAV